MKKYLLIATALAALASCSSNEFVGDEAIGEANGQAAISFNTNVPAATRADKTGEDAATDLGNQFIVYGEKNSGTSDAKTAPEEGHLVFQNYQVNWVTNTANTSTSNTKDWEYVGYTHSAGYQSNITTKDGTETAANALTVPQTIKYWDYSAGSYTFTAVSAKQDDITDGKIKIQKNTSSESDAYEKGYTITVTSGASLDKLFFSDRKVITKTNGTDRTATNAYGGNVTFNFRNVQSQVRVGIYETIPGYDISAIKFYVTSDAEAKDGDNSAFGAICPNKKAASYTGTLTITYEKSGTSENHPLVTSNGTATADLILGTNINAISKTSRMGTAANNPTWDTSDGKYTVVMPQADNNTNLTLKCDYTLYNDYSKETIEVKGATAEIPAEYLCWKPNYKYTYLFKISDNTNGSSGQGVTGLYPITFDAVETIAADGQAEYITTVSEPSITTFGVSAGKYSVGKSEYDASTDVYATVMDASALATLSASNFSIYDVTTSDNNFPVTEASVAEALIEGPTWTKAQADQKKITCAAGPTLTFQKTVPAEDGTTKTLHTSDNKAAKFTTATGKKYAIVYMKTAATYTVDAGSTYTDETAFNNAGTLYTSIACTDVATWGNSSTQYYKRTAVSNKGVYVIKIVTVE